MPPTKRVLFTDQQSWRPVFDQAATGVVTTAAAIDRETLGPSVSIGVTATSTDGSSASQTFSIAINDVNEAPVSGADTVITNVGTGNSFVIPEWALLANDADRKAQRSTSTESDLQPAGLRFTPRAAGPRAS
jgi:hypothetical protein